MRLLRPHAIAWPIIATLLLVSFAFADIVDMKDGRRFEGLIVNETDSQMHIDTVAKGIRATIALPADEISSSKRQPLPDGFFAPPPPPPRVSDPKAFKPQDTLYLEIPIVGQFGQDIFAEGIRNALEYAATHRIPHVVFTIDSRGANNLDEAVETHRVLKAHADQVTYHAILRNCTGDALAVAIHCDSIFVAPGAVVGAAHVLPAPNANLSPEDAQTLRAQLIREAVSTVRARGGNGRFVQAFLDPTYKLAAWMNEAGKIEIGEEPSASVPADRLIFKVGAGQQLVLSAEQVARLGLPLFPGNAQDLGALLQISTWRAESTYGSTAMQNAAKKAQAQLAAKQGQFESRVADNISRRQSADRALRYLIRQAETNDPSNASYESYSVRWGRGWTSGQSEVMKDSSRRQWQWRTDQALGFLDEAHQAATTLKHLDAEAVELGLQTTYKPGELDGILKDLTARRDTLAANRDKTEL
ncbi:MAG TPA: hypothetical protein VHP11_03625 [Tepidisphaeraceae bacterium]|nr:hypothetical protein [Tepidisphaeraceae bacterium]